MTLDQTAMILGEIKSGVSSLGKRVDREAQASANHREKMDRDSEGFKDDLALFNAKLSELQSELSGLQSEVAKITPVTDRVKRAEVLFWAGTSIAGGIAAWLTWGTNKGAAILRTLFGGGA